MITVTACNEAGVTVIHAEWKLYESPLFDKWAGRLLSYESWQVIAYGPELEYIRQNFSGIRMAPTSQVCWFGRDAEFIINHIGRKV